MGILAPIEQVELPIVVRTFHILEGETLKQKSQASHNIYIYSWTSCLPFVREREGEYRIRVYRSFIQYESLEMWYAAQKLLYLVDLTSRIGFKDPKLVYPRSFEMNQQQTYRGPSFYVG